MSSYPEQADLIVDMMLNNDAFSRWLGIKVVDILPGFCQLQIGLNTIVVYPLIGCIYPLL